MKKLIDCAMKREKADLVIKNANIFNAFTGELERGDIAVSDGKIIGIGENYPAEETIDANGLFALPGFIDAHIHVESSTLAPEEFAALAVMHGTSVIVADPHEIVNVMGTDGATYLSEAFSRIEYRGVQPLEVCMQLPSCVPASPFETSGAIIGAAATERAIRHERFYGLGEMMNYPAVLNGDEETLRKIQAAHDCGKIVDGHAPALSDDALNAYACAGIKTDHECVSPKDCLEKVRRGLYVQLRNGSSARNLEENATAMNAYNYRRFMLCSDDRSAFDLKNAGEIDDALRRLVACGIPAPWAIACATINTAECYGLKNKGAIAPGYDADIVLVTDLTAFNVHTVFKRGVVVAKNQKALFDESKRYLPSAVRSTVRICPVTEKDFAIAYRYTRARAIKVIPNSIMTEEEIINVETKDGDVLLPDGVNKLAVIERHFRSGNIGKCLVHGYGLRGGAVALTVAHDSHNIVVLGDNNADMVRAVSLLEQSGGGMAVVSGDCADVFALDIAGLMSSAPADEVIARTKEIADRAKTLGVAEGIEPFMTLVFLSLPVIPALRLTDRGLVDVNQFKLVSSESEF